MRGSEQTENKVLYIDDEETNLLLFQAMFSGYYSISLARSTREAEKIMSTEKFKVIVSDISMPNETGLQFFNRIPKTENSPVFIILTAYVTDTFLLEALNQGRIYRYITKPLEKDTVKDVLDQAIQQFDIQYENRQLYLQILESQRNFYNIFQSSQDGIAIIDPNEIILEANIVFANSLKINHLNLPGRKLQDVIPPTIYPKIKEKFSDLFQYPAARHEFEYYSETNGKRNLELNSSLIDYKGTKSALIIFRDITERRNNELKLLNAVVEAEEKERSRLAKDLHDGLGPIMSSLKMYLEYLNKQEKVTDHPDILDLSLKSINEAIITLKRISNNLSPHILEKFGLIAALNKYIDNIRKINQTEFYTEINFCKRLDLTTEMSLYRIITECITNTIRHAQATSISIILRQDSRLVYFSYKDNGIGFNFPEDPKYENGLGLHNINNRIKTMGGKIVMQSQPGVGFILESEIPII